MRVGAGTIGRLSSRTQIRAALLALSVAVPCACGAIWGFEEGTLGTPSGTGLAAGGGDLGGSGGAAGSSPTGGQGGAVIPALCPNGWGGFGSASPIGALNSSNSDIDPAVSADGLTLYFASTSGGGAGGSDINYDLYVATRADAGASFDGFVPVAELNSGASDWSPDLAPGGLALYFSSRRAGGAGSFDIWVATRSVADGPFLDAGVLAALNTVGEDIDPAISADGKTLYFATDEGGGGGRAIWYATRESTDAGFEPRGRLEEVWSTDSQFDPAISSDGRELFFTRNTSDAARNLWVARRDLPWGSFVTVVAVDSLNTPDDDFAPALSADGTTLYFATNRDAAGSWDLWSATRSCLE